MATEKTEAEFPGKEGFWEQSPELIELQGDLAKLWQALEALPEFSETELTGRIAGDIIAIRTKNRQYEGYRIFELGSTPRIESMYPRKPFDIRPRITKDPQDAQIKLYMEKWPGGYRIDGEPVIDGYDWGEYVQQGEAEYKIVPESLRGDGIRLVALKMMAKEKRQDPEAAAKAERILNIVKKETGDI